MYSPTRGQLGPEAAIRHPEIDTVTAARICQPSSPLRQGEPALLQPAVVEPEPVMVTMRYIDLVPLAVTEGEQAGSKGVEREAGRDLDEHSPGTCFRQHPLHSIAGTATLEMSFVASLR